LEVVDPVFGFSRLHYLAWLLLLHAPPFATLLLSILQQPAKSADEQFACVLSA
jgi:hypothetical protein